MIDHHVHLGIDSNRTQFSLNTKTIIERLNRFGLAGAIIFPCPSITTQRTNPYKTENRKVLKARLEDKRLIPFMFIHPILDTLDYVANEQEKFFGYKVCPRAAGMEYFYRSIKKGDLMDFLSNSEKPIIFHASSRDGMHPSEIIWFIKSKKGPVVLAHSADLMDKELRSVSKFDNVYIDISPLATMVSRGYYVAPKQRAACLKELSTKKILRYLENLFGKERILWGSDSPWCDNLLEDGYSGEVKISLEMMHRGFNHSFLKI